MAKILLVVISITYAAFLAWPVDGIPHDKQVTYSLAAVLIAFTAGVFVSPDKHD